MGLKVFWILHHANQLRQNAQLTSASLLAWRGAILCSLILLSSNPTYLRKLILLSLECGPAAIHKQTHWSSSIQRLRFLCPRHSKPLLRWYAICVPTVRSSTAAISSSEFGKHSYLRFLLVNDLTASIQGAIIDRSNVRLTHANNHSLSTATSIATSLPSTLELRFLLSTSALTKAATDHKEVATKASPGRTHLHDTSRPAINILGLGRLWTYINFDHPR